MSDSGPPKPPADPALRPLSDFKGARDSLSPQERLRQIRRRAAAFRERLLSQPAVRFYQSCPLVRVPYPTRFGFLNACTVPMPMMHIVNRLFVVQFDTPAGLRTLLCSPSDVIGGRETPYFKRLARRAALLGERGERLMAPILGSVEGWLETLGLRPEQIDYLSYDHLHTQDLRRWLGSGDRPGFFPRARLLVMRKEWESAQALLPPQADWYCPRGTEGIDPARVELLDGDVMLGESVALLHTPGHTEGNHSFVVRTPRGLLVTSENGVGADSYAPLASRIPGLRRYAQDTGVEVILNGNTQEGGLDQYLSMVQEKEIAGPCPDNPSFFNVATSSEMDAYWLFPGLRPTYRFGDLRFGAPGGVDAGAAGGASKRRAVSADLAAASRINGPGGAA